MIGGIVTEVIDIGTRIWINTKDEHGDYCAIYVECDSKSLCVSEGDSVWWQAGWALWTPLKRNGKHVGPRDVKLTRIGNSGVPRPDAPPHSAGYHSCAVAQADAQQDVPEVNFGNPKPRTCGERFYCKNTCAEFVEETGRACSMFHPRADAEKGGAK